MSEAALTATVPPGDIREVLRLMKLRSRLLAEDAGRTVVFTAWFVARAASAAVRTAPKFRQVVKNPAAKEGDRRRAKFAIKRFTRSGAIKLIPIKKETKEEARADPRAMIGRRGLAKDAWSWILGELGKATGKQLNKKRASYFRVEQRIKQLNPAVILTNRLDYAALAWKTRGRATVNNIMRRAANSMRKDLERRAKRTIKATT